MSARFEYLRDPAAIYRQSFERVSAATDLRHLPPPLDEVALRLVHACAMPDIVDDLAWSNGAHNPASKGRQALAAGAPVIVDCAMLAAGISRARLPRANEIICTLNHAEVPALAAARQTTRSAAAVALWQPHLAGSIVAIGNAPTALFRLLELLVDNPNLAPALILGFPVGFVGAQESKQALIESGLGIPFIALRGRRGGSALASAAVNALASPDR